MKSLCFVLTFLVGRVFDFCLHFTQLMFLYFFFFCIYCFSLSCYRLFSHLPSRNGSWAVKPSFFSPIPFSKLLLLWLSTSLESWACALVCTHTECLRLAESPFISEGCSSTRECVLEIGGGITRGSWPAPWVSVPVPRGWRYMAMVQTPCASALFSRYRRRNSELS